MDQSQPLPHTTPSFLAANLKYLLAGTLFGFVAIRSEIISWYRIQEMFRFQSFHMYGIIGSAVLVGALSLLILKRLRVKSLEGQELSLRPKDRSLPRTVLGGTVFGLGWALTGACPGPIYALIGSGFSGFIVVLVSALLGAWVYGTVRPKLPH
ncbi:MAG: YeeE/YedE family protein [Trueperaceae bacterium]|nr:MAG: YeeE/YedE family protein [Trueperaceae bacterium]